MLLGGSLIIPVACVGKLFISETLAGTENNLHLNLVMN